MVEIVVVESVDEEDAVLGRCVCGCGWSVVGEEVAPVRDHWYDALVVRCVGCGQVRRKIFDITPFFEPPTHAWIGIAS
jgi:hypothetical protein